MRVNCELCRYSLVETFLLSACLVQQEVNYRKKHKDRHAAKEGHNNKFEAINPIINPNMKTNPQTNIMTNMKKNMETNINTNMQSYKENITMPLELNVIMNLQTIIKSNIDKP